MLFIIIVICLAIQRWLSWDKYERKNRWFYCYYEWLSAQLSHLSFWPGIGGFCFIIIPVLVLYAVLAAIAYYVFTVVGYYFLTLLILWYFMDARFIRIDLEGQENRDTRDIFINVYQRIFALIFWLLILGASGILLYALLLQLQIFLKTGEEDSKSKALLSFSVKVGAVLDWIPVRLLGITYALAGQFSSVFKLWYDNLFTGLSATLEQVAVYGLAALGKVSREETTGSLSAGMVKSVNSLVNRSLGIWLFIIAVFTAGFWIG